MNIELGWWATDVNATTGSSCSICNPLPSSFDLTCRKSVGGKFIEISHGEYRWQIENDDGITEGIANKGAR